jgi:hypothetical protein
MAGTISLKEMNQRLGLNQVTSDGYNYKMKSFKFQIIIII